MIREYLEECWCLITREEHLVVMANVKRYKDIDAAQIQRQNINALSQADKVISRGTRLSCASSGG